ncbi:hypothetical protein [Cohnella yongneupensis]|uniref:Uncharacterized protein n=1 Tax=Cohnella yongneupensis TaxID=425006 RepID=A0ABW0QVB6_9BACL
MPRKHHPSIFRELKDFYQDIKARLSDDVYSGDVDLNHEKLKNIREMTKFIESFSWVKKEDMKHRIIFYLKNGLNAEKTAAHFGVTKDAIEASIKYYSDTVLQPIIGAALKDLVQSEDIISVNTAMLKFRRSAQSKVPNNYFLPGIFELLPEQGFDYSLTLEDCRSEVLLLTVFTRSNAEYLFKNANRSKLSYIRNLLCSNNGSDIELEGLRLLLEGKFNTIEGEDGGLSNQDQLDRMFQCMKEQSPFNV